MKALFKYIFSLLSIFAFLAIVIDSFNKGGENEKEKNEQKPMRKIAKTKSVNFVSKEYKESLNDRQVKILKMFKSREIVYPSDIYALLPSVSTRTIRRDMTYLSDLNIVVQKGNTRDARYLLSNETHEI